MPARLTLPEKPCSRVRPWIDDGGDAGLLEFAGEIRRGAIRVVPAEPHLDGDGDAHRFDDRCGPGATVLPTLHIIAEPPPFLTTLWTGQPMLMSMTAAP